MRREVVRPGRRRRRWSFRPRPWMIPATFAVVIAIGAVVLMLPVSSQSGEWTHPVDALFTSTSAVCVTGLVRFDTAEHWSAFGEAVIAVLLQAGGLGVTMYAGALLLIFGGRLGLRGREFFSMELSDVTEHDLVRLLRRVMLFTAAVELTAFLLLVPWFVVDGAGLGALWKALFTSLSAFNNAGFDLQGGGTSFIGQASSPYLLLVLGTCAFLGSLSFLTAFNMRMPLRRWTLDTRLTAIGMFGFLGAGIVLLLLAEAARDGVLSGLHPLHQAVNAFFLSVNARTTGMSTVDLALLDDATAAALLLFMFVGGASTSTASGIKVGSFMVAMVALHSALRGRRTASAFGREIPEAIVLRAIAVTIVGFFTLGAGVWLVGVTDDLDFLTVLFEVTSAFGNVGWSQGATPQLSHAGALVIVGLMFFGRLAPMYIALSVPDRPITRYRYPRGSVRIG
jgi:trk system potassium uptake protein TrkH